MNDERFTELVNAYLDKEINSYEFEQLMREVKNSSERKAIFQKHCRIQAAMQMAMKRPHLDDAPERPASALAAVVRAVEHQALAIAASVVITLTLGFYWYANLVELEQQSTLTAAELAPVDEPEPLVAKRTLEGTASAAQESLILSSHREKPALQQLQGTALLPMQYTDPLEPYPYLGRGFDASPQPPLREAVLVDNLPNGLH